jgi:hypothetical protein
MATKTVLLLGVSTIWEAEPGGTNLTELVAQELRNRTSNPDWRGEYEVLYLAPNTATRALASIERNRPDAVVLCLGAHQFADSYSVGLRVRNRWPRLHAVVDWTTRPLARRLRRYRWARKAGDKLRSLPHFVGRKLIGVDAMLSTEQAILYARQAIDAIQATGIAWACELVGQAATSTTEERRQRVRTYKAEQAEYLQQSGVSYYDLEAKAAEAGHTLQLLPDGLHLGLASRRFEAGVIAGLLVEALEARRNEEVTEAK